jgi:hypothetical protein
MRHRDVKQVQKNAYSSTDFLGLKPVGLSTALNDGETKIH